MREITEHALWKSWKEIRKRLRRSSLRDVVDFIDYDVNPEVWIRRILRELRSGSYEPRKPHRFAIGKSKGFSRWMTLPYIPDLVLFHAISTCLVTRAQKRRRRHRNVYFARDVFDKVSRRSQQEAQVDMDNERAQYGQDSFLAWLRFDEYRKRLILNKIYPYIVITDITNFFDSIAHIQIEATLMELGFSRSFAGLLQVLLERLMFRDPFTAHPRVGIPVDEFDCSRCLAHVVLFPHDDRMVKTVGGEERYVRWMDDQAFGVESEAEGLEVLSEVNISLRRLHLAPNAEKTKILSLPQVRRWYHFTTNKRLDELQVLWETNKPLGRTSARLQRAMFGDLWRRHRNFEGEGEWGKVLKRLYLAAGRLGLRRLVSRSHNDVVLDPSLAVRIAAYLRHVCDTGEFVSRMNQIFQDRRIVYEDVHRAFAEQLLFIEPANSSERTMLRALATRSLKRRTGVKVPEDIAALMLIRFGDGRSARSLLAYLKRNPQSLWRTCRKLGAGLLWRKLHGWTEENARSISRAAGDSVRAFE